MKRLVALSTVLVACIGMLVAAAPALAYSTSSISAVAGTPLPGSTVLATFTDGYDLLECNSASTYTATANWGDGSGALDATVTGPVDPEILQPCEYSVVAGHIYTLPGSYPLMVDVSGGGDPGSAAGTVNVADAPITAGSGSELAGLAGQTLSGAVGTFTAQNTLAPASYYSATVSWGDGSSASASVSAGANPGQLSVTAQHAYAVAGDYVATVTLTDGDGETSSLQDYVDVSDAGLVAGALLPRSGGDAKPLGGTVAQFSTPDPSAPASYYTATINWGDGSTSAGQVVPAGSPGTFVVDAEHVYTRAGAMDAAVTVSDGDHESITMNEPVTINLLPGQLSSVYAPTIHTQPLDQFIGAVTDFGYAGGSAADLHATVHWGDGQITGANVVELTSSPIYGDLYAVDADHTYATAGTYALTATVRAADGKVLTVPVQVVVATAPAADFTMPLGDVHFSADSLDAHVTCPPGESLCRGYLSASVRVRSVVKTLAATYFILPGRRSAIVDLPIYPSQLTALGVRGRTSIELQAVAVDPSRGRRATAQLTVIHRFPG